MPIIGPNVPVVALSDSELASIGKLLLNAWSAEYALRIRPLNPDRDFLNTSLTWTFPQAYHAVLFSARAVLAVDGVQLANPETIEKLLCEWAHGGMYGPSYTREANPFAEVTQYRLTSNRPAKKLNGPEAAAMHVKLTNKVHAVGIIHETYILGRLGADVYQKLIDSMPVYLQDGFVSARATLLLSDD